MKLVVKHMSPRVALLAFIMAPLAAQADGDAPVDPRSESPPPSLVEVLADRQEPALTVNEPMYFVVGKDGGDTKARFQLSLKYRILDENSEIVQKLPWLENLHFAYTQTSLWNLSKDSAPFEDTSYRPSLFWEFGRMRGPDRTRFLRVGYEHESNGQAGEKSRSIDTLFFMPGLATRAFGRDLVFTPKLYTYLERSDNPDIADYRGHGDFIVRYGNDDSTVIQLMYRHGKSGRHTTQLDLSIPIRERIFARTGAFFYVQAFDGYGETLRNYNQRTSWNVRVGLAIVR